MAASGRSSARRRQYEIAPENEDAAMWLDTVATETAGATPRKISSGVIRKPPPMPNMPEMKPTARSMEWFASPPARRERSYSVAHVPVGESAATPDQIRGGLSPEHALVK